MADKPTLTLIDGSAYIYRAYHAIPHLSTSRGQPTNAVYGFTNMVLRALRERDPSHVAVVFDGPRGKTFRVQIDPTYKANRPAPPDDLISQFPLIRKVTAALNLPVLEVEGVEADDVIATLAVRAVKDGFRVLIITGDKDFMQLVNDDVELFDSMRDKHTDAKEVESKLGVKPAQVVDYMSLIGDEVDNVPGLEGVGPKNAAKLIQDFGSLEGVITHVNKISKPKLKEQIQAKKEQLRKNQQLIALKLDVHLELKPADLVRKAIDAEACRDLFADLEFSKLVANLPAPPREKLAAAATQTIIVRDEHALAELVKKLAHSPRVAVRTLAPHGGKPVGIAFAIEGAAYYVPVAHRSLLLGAQLQVGEAKAWHALKPFLEGNVPKVGHCLKDDWWNLRRVGIELRPIASDAELASFLLNAARREHALADLSRERLGRELPPDVHETGKKARPLEEIEIERAAAFAGASADAAFALCNAMEKELHAQGPLWKLYSEMEIPLEPILGEMEANGVLLDSTKLNTLGAKIDSELGGLLKQIYKHAGHEFAVGSNQQLGKVLFEELKLPVQRKTKTGASVDQETLEKLAEQHPLPAVVIEYRGLAKLKSTYLDTLPTLVDGAGRVHTTFIQTGAATGRLSSVDPNLQNIPVRTDVGRQIRDAFVASPHHVLVSADYSQIELRILAHISGDPALLDSFTKGEDVHTRTAAEVYGVKLDQVKPEQRRAAKAVNFGIAYGQTAYGLAARLQIESDEAQKIIDRYFERYKGVRAWLDGTIEKAKRDVQVETLAGRRRGVADILSRNNQLRTAAERIAVNTPIQGTAADIVKTAMIRVDRRMKAEKLASKMLLQVHDELLFEVPDKEIKQLEALAKEEMEGTMQLKAKLVVEVGHAHSWGSAH
jgi:DNA polymerase-1